MIAAWRTRTVQGLDRWQNSGAGRFYGRARDLNIVTHVLALGAQQVLCTAPLVVAVSAVLQRATGKGMGTLLARLFGLTPDATAMVDRLFSGSTRVGLGELLIGMVLALLFGTGVAATQQRGFELLWGLPRMDGFRVQLRQLLWALALAAYITLMIASGRLGRWIGHRVLLDSWTAALLEGLVSAAFYWWGQHLLLGHRVSYRSLLPGALCVGVGMIALFKISPLILSEQITEEVHDYGLIGAVFVLSIWLMVLSAVLMGGVMGGVVIVRREAAMQPVTDLVATSRPTVGLTEPASPRPEPAVARPEPAVGPPDAA